MRIGLLFGGKSFEHDISIITANIIYHALKEKFEVVLLYIDKKGDFKIPKKLLINDFAVNKKFKDFNFRKRGIVVGCKRKKIDVLINAMHGINGEDGLGSVIANLYDIPYVGSNHISSGLLMDKYFTYAILRSNNIKTINTKFYFKGDVLASRTYPLIVKPARLGSSIGISKITNLDELITKSNDAFLFDDKIVIQPYISDFKEFNQAAYLYNGEIIVSNVEEVFKSEEILSFDDKYTTSKAPKKHAFVTDVDLVEKITNITKKIYRVLELGGIVRIDYMLTSNEILVNEINTTPGSLAYYLFEDKILNLLEKQIHTALKVFQNKKNTTFESSVLSQNYTIKK